MRKKKSIQENTDLASQYRTAQNDYMTLKDKLMNNFEDRVKLENAIKDCRQVGTLALFLAHLYECAGRPVALVSVHWH